VFITGIPPKPGRATAHRLRREYLKRRGPSKTPASMRFGTPLRMNV